MEAEDLAQLYGRMSGTNGVTNEYFRTNYLRPTAWEQLRQRFNFDMGDIGEIIWKRWTDDAENREKVGTWSDDIAKLVKHFKNLRNAKPAIEGDRFLQNIRNIPFEFGNPEQGMTRMADFRRQITDALTSSSDGHEIDRVTAENLVLQRISADNRRPGVDLVNEIKVVLSGFEIPS
jgi:hypothetical protein